MHSYYITHHRHSQQVRKLPDHEYRRIRNANRGITWTKASDMPHNVECGRLADGRCIYRVREITAPDRD